MTQRKDTRRAPEAQASAEGRGNGGSASSRALAYSSPSPLPRCAAPIGHTWRRSHRRWPAAVSLQRVSCSLRAGRVQLSSGAASARYGSDARSRPAAAEAGEGAAQPPRGLFTAELPRVLAACARAAAQRRLTSDCTGLSPRGRSDRDRQESGARPEWTEGSREGRR